MQRTKTEKPNSNWSTLTVFWKRRGTTPAKPPIDAPSAKAHSFMRTRLTPIAAAATSSSRTAIQARPRRESRRRTLTNSTPSSIARAMK